ncbi:hypothetical protein EGJ53_26655 [Pseudomonas fluorescens]|nr:hypothetical protein EGJ53_26655 [Pseudomonas fluorescens]
MKGRRRRSKHRVVPFASRLAPTLDLCHAQIPCGSEPARERGLENTELINPGAKPLSRSTARDHALR